MNVRTCLSGKGFGRQTSEKNYTEEQNNCWDTELSVGASDRMHKALGSVTGKWMGVLAEGMGMAEKMTEVASQRGRVCWRWVQGT